MKKIMILALWCGVLSAEPLDSWSRTETAFAGAGVGLAAGILFKHKEFAARWGAWQDARSAHRQAVAKRALKKELDQSKAVRDAAFFALFRTTVKILGVTATAAFLGGALQHYRQQRAAKKVLVVPGANNPLANAWFARNQAARFDLAVARVTTSQSAGDGFKFMLGSVDYSSNILAAYLQNEDHVIVFDKDFNKYESSLKSKSISQGERGEVIVCLNLHSKLSKDQCLEYLSDCLRSKRTKFFYVNPGFGDAMNWAEESRTKMSLVEVKALLGTLQLEEMVVAASNASHFLSLLEANNDRITGCLHQLSDDASGKLKEFLCHTSLGGSVEDALRKRNAGSITRLHNGTISFQVFRVDDESKFVVLTLSDDSEVKRADIEYVVRKENNSEGIWHVLLKNQGNGLLLYTVTQSDDPSLYKVTQNFSLEDAGKLLDDLVTDGYKAFVIRYDGTLVERQLPRYCGSYQVPTVLVDQERIPYENIGILPLTQKVPLILIRKWDDGMFYSKIVREGTYQRTDRVYSNRADKFERYNKTEALQCIEELVKGSKPFYLNLEVLNRNASEDEKITREDLQHIGLEPDNKGALWFDAFTYFQVATV